MADVFYYICDWKRKIADGKCTGESCKGLHRKFGNCERTADPKYAKNKFDISNFGFVEHREQNDTDYYSEKDSKGEYL